MTGSGGGIGGLTLACALSRFKDISVDVYERAADFNTEIGAGISIVARNMPFLSELGLAEEIAAINGRSSQAEGKAFTLEHECLLTDLVDDGRCSAYAV